MQKLKESGRAQRRKELKFFLALVVMFIIYSVGVKQFNVYWNNHKITMVRNHMEQAATHGVPSAKAWILAHPATGDVSQESISALKTMADKGEPSAQWYFGIHENEMGDLVAGDRYIQQAADQGNLLAIEHLAEIEMKKRIRDF